DEEPVFVADGGEGAAVTAEDLKAESSLESIDNRRWVLDRETELGELENHRGGEGAFGVVCEVSAGDEFQNVPVRVLEVDRPGIPALEVVDLLAEHREVLAGPRFRVLDLVRRDVEGKVIRTRRRPLDEVHVAAPPPKAIRPGLESESLGVEPAHRLGCAGGELYLAEDHPGDRNITAGCRGRWGGHTLGAGVSRVRRSSPSRPARLRRRLPPAARRACSARHEEAG